MQKVSFEVSINRCIHPAAMSHFHFAYAANESRRVGAASVLVFFSPLDKIAWAWLAFSSPAKVILLKFGGNVYFGFNLLGLATLLLEFASLLKVKVVV